MKISHCASEPTDGISQEAKALLDHLVDTHGEYDRQAFIYALEDGEFLEKLDEDQATIEELHYALSVGAI